MLWDLGLRTRITSINLSVSYLSMWDLRMSLRTSDWLAWSTYQGQAPKSQNCIPMVAADGSTSYDRAWGAWQNWHGSGRTQCAVPRRFWRKEHSADKCRWENCPP
jgi:hypothetical protein